jgi:hypothetical protein
LRVKESGTEVDRLLRVVLQGREILALCGAEKPMTTSTTLWSFSLSTRTSVRHMMVRSGGCYSGGFVIA